MTAVYDAWCSLREVYAPLIARVAARYGITTERLLQSSLLCVALHDVGKLTRNFANMMRATETEYKSAVRQNYRHEVASLWLVTQAARAMNKRQGIFPGDGLLETLAVAGHHKYLADGYLFDEEKFVGKALAWEHGVTQDVSAALELARLMFEEQGWRFPKFKTSSEELERFLTQTNSAQHSPPYDHLAETRSRLSIMVAESKADFRDLFVLLKGLLMTADWMASGAQGKDEGLDAARGVVRVCPAALEVHVRARVERRRANRPHLVAKPFEYTRFQAACATANGHLVAIAPTGSGKTEASWLWALRQVERGHVRKILVLLPTMVTANSIHDRLCAFLSEHGHEVGLVHSTADLIRQETDLGDDEADRPDVRAGYLRETHFFRPATVGTVDQLLVPLFHAGRWAMKMMAAADSAIIIDEIHAYEPHTLGLVVLMIKQLAPLGARFMIMSATMPGALEMTIREALSSGGGDVPLGPTIRDDDLLTSARNVWKTVDTPLSQWLFRHDERGRSAPSAEILGLWGQRNDRGEPLKILIVVNTVKRCQSLARDLRKFGFDLVCYHSKFTFDDRRAKERRINEDPPRLLLATQVVEVALDIDYDVLLTECAPIDALVQRAGRVNRARQPILGRVWIFPAEEGSEIVYGRPEGVLGATWDLCRSLTDPPTESELTKMVDTIYKDLKPHVDNDFHQIQRNVEAHQRRLAGVLDAPRPYEENALMKTRKDDYPQVSVIPSCFEAIVKSCPVGDRRLYELKVPAWYALKHNLRTDEIPLCSMGYGPEFGADLPGLRGLGP